MPTVDDLVISLTIEPTSELGQLKKQLDDLLGIESEEIGAIKTGEATIPSFIIEDIAYIRSSIDFLIPNISYGTDKIGLFMKEAQILNLNLFKYRDNILDWLTGAKEDDLRKMKEMMGMSEESTVTDVRNELEWLLLQFHEKLNKQSSGVWTDENAKKFKDSIKNMMNDITTQKNPRLYTFLGNIMKQMKEPQTELENILSKLGMLGATQEETLEMNKNFFMRLESGLGTKMDKYTEFINKAREDLKQYFEDEEKPYATALMEMIRTKFPEAVGRSIEESLGKISKDDRETIVATILAVEQGRERKRNFFLPRQLFDDFKSFVKFSNINLYDSTRTDITIGLQKLRDDLDLQKKFLDGLQPNTRKIFEEALETEQEFFITELKSLLLGGQTMKQIKQGVKMFGKDYLVLAYRFVDTAIKKMNDMEVKFGNIIPAKLKTMLDLVEDQEKPEEILERLKKMNEGQLEFFSNYLGEKIELNVDDAEDKLTELMESLEERQKESKEETDVEERIKANEDIKNIRGDINKISGFLDVSKPRIDLDDFMNYVKSSLKETEERIINEAGTDKVYKIFERMYKDGYANLGSLEITIKELIAQIQNSNRTPASIKEKETKPRTD